MAGHNAVLFALADPTRQRILERLKGGGKAVGEIADGLPVSRPAVSQHLKVLKGAGLVHEVRVGTRRVYNLEAKGIVELRRYVDRMWEDVLMAFTERARAETPGRKRGSR